MFLFLVTFRFTPQTIEHRAATGEVEEGATQEQSDQARALARRTCSAMCGHWDMHRDWSHSFVYLPCVFVAAAADLDDLFEKVEVARDELDAGSALKSALTLQIEQMKEEALNPFSHYARYDGKVKHAFRLIVID